MTDAKRILVTLRCEYCQHELDEPDMPRTLLNGRLYCNPVCMVKDNNPPAVEGHFNSAKMGMKL